MNKLIQTSSRSNFPDPLTADEAGIVAAGGELSLDLLVDAYYHGIFPWPHEGYPLLWFFPFERGVLEFKDLHISQSLKKYMRKNNFGLRSRLVFSNMYNTTILSSQSA